VALAQRRPQHRLPGNKKASSGVEISRTTHDSLSVVGVGVYTHRPIITHMNPTPTESSPTQSPPIHVLIYVRDLLFSSKIVATARAHDVAFRVVRDYSKLMDTPAAHLLVDLNEPDRLSMAVAWKQKYAGRVTGFASHVSVETLAEARAAGIDRVMTNGSFTANLETIVSQADNDKLSNNP